MKIGILAGTYGQARTCAAERRLCPRDWFYVSDKWRLRGMRGMTIWRYGTPYDRCDYDEVIEMARVYECDVVEAPDSSAARFYG